MDEGETGSSMTNDVVIALKQESERAANQSEDDNMGAPSRLDVVDLGDDEFDFTLDASPDSKPESASSSAVGARTSVSTTHGRPVGVNLSSSAGVSVGVVKKQGSTKPQVYQRAISIAGEEPPGSRLGLSSRMSGVTSGVVLDSVPAAPQPVTSALPPSSRLPTSATTAGAGGKTKEKQVYEAVQAEWNTVINITQDGDAGNSDDDVEERAQTDAITYSEAIHHFRNTNLSQYKNGIKVSINRPFLAACKHFIFGPPKLSPLLFDERDTLFELALCPFDNADRCHIRMLQTIYKKLMKVKFDCPRYGSHWEKIGFQGNDPATDLRGAGCLALLNLLYLVTDSGLSPLVTDIYHLSHHHTQNFPFCLMGINLTRLCLQIFREECVNRLCNSRQEVIAVHNELYAALYYKLYQVWRYQHKTIADSGFVLRNMEELGRQRWKGCLRELQHYRDGTGMSKKKSTAASAVSGHSGHSSLKGEFTGICDLLSRDR